MVDELTDRSATVLEADLLHQLLHGYAQGHRLLHGSIKVPDELSRLFLRMSDLSGNDVTRGFEDYVTGYPVPSLGVYALGKTWYASEMPRPGCVWTHTILIPTLVMARLSSLGGLRRLFKRPGGFDQASFYGKPLPISDTLHQESILVRTLSEPTLPLPILFSMFYCVESKALLLPSKTSYEFEEDLFAMWSQQWPSLRMQFTFCTGSLSNRTYNQNPLDIQCVPISLTREVSRESAAAKGLRPEIVSIVSKETPSWAVTAAADALSSDHSDLREFLWSVADSDSGRGDFASFVRVFEELTHSQSSLDVIDAVATAFPSANDGRRTKSFLFAGRASDSKLRRFDEAEILLGLARTRYAESFDAASLEVRSRGATLCSNDPVSAKHLIAELFTTTLNPLGEEILGGLLSTMDAEMAQDIVCQRPELLPTLFRQNGHLATSTSLWIMGGDHRRELFDSVASIDKLDPVLVPAIIAAILDSNGQGLIRLVLEKWGAAAVTPILDWTDSHSGEMWEACRHALTFYLPAVMDWVESHPLASYECLASVAHVVAPYSYKIAQRESGVWRRTLESIASSGSVGEKTYICTLLLALGFGNAPPSPLDLLAQSFEHIHEIAERDQMTDDAWVIMAPLVPELPWYSNWDKCERLRRGLVIAFLKHSWPASALSSVVRNKRIRKQILKSARKIEGGEEYFVHAHLSESAITDERSNT